MDVDAIGLTVHPGIHMEAVCKRRREGRVADLHCELA